jgi:hypothetical protein
MSAEPIDSQAALAAYEAELAQVDAMIEELYAKQDALKEIIAGLKKLVNVNDGTTKSMTVVPKHAYKEKTIVEAAEMYLRTVNTPQTNRELVSGLERGGKTGGTNFTDTVRSVLLRHMTLKGVFRWRNKKWELAEWPEDDS